MTGAATRISRARRDREGRQFGSPDRCARCTETEAKPARDHGPACAPIDGARDNGCSVHDAPESGGAEGRRVDLHSELRVVQESDRDALAARWRQIHDHDPPPRLSRELMVRAICYAMQVEAHGGLDRPTQRRLEQLVAEMQSGKAPTEAAFRIKPGTRLIREWHGEIHEVVVLEEGFVFRGRVHRSLSAIAREITGTSWNGHAFFGLRRRGERAASNDDASGDAQPTQRVPAVSEPGDG